MGEPAYESKDEILKLDFERVMLQFPLMRGPSMQLAPKLEIAQMVRDPRTCSMTGA
jgi:hypothetical protein